MNFEVIWLDLTMNLAMGRLPVHVIERPPIHQEPKAWGGPSEVAREGKFYVPQLDAFQADPVWVITDMGQYVRIPVHAYKTNSRNLASIWGMGIQVGLAFLDSFRSHTNDPVRSAILVLGSDCTDLFSEGSNAFRAYVGLAIKS